MKRLRVLFSLAGVLAFLGVTAIAPGSAVAAKKTKTVIIGCTASLTGNLNVEGTRQLHGLELWAHQVNKAGGIRLPDGSHLRVAIKYYDDESKKDRVQQLYTRLITNDKVNFLMGPYSSGLTDAAAIIAQQYNRIMIGAGGASDSTYHKGYTLVYQPPTPASRYLTGAVDILMKYAPQAKKIAMIHGNDVFSTDATTALKAYAEKKGLQVVMNESYDASTTDFAPYIDKIPKGVDAIIGGGHFSDTATLARQLYEKKVHVKMIALLVGPLEPKWAELGNAAFGVIGPSQWEPIAKYSPQSAKAENIPWFGPTVPEFIKLYEAKYHKEPSYHSANGYQAGLIIQKAVENAGSIDTKKVAAALNNMDIYTFYGRVKFSTAPDSHGLQEGHEMIYIQWQRDKQGKLVKVGVWPPAAATAKPMILQSTY